MPALLRRVPKADYICAFLLFVLLSIDLTGLKIERVDQQFGDTAQLAEVVENIDTRGVPENQIMPSLLEFVKQHLPTLHAPQYATAPLSAPVLYEQNHLQFHAYLIVYPIAVLARFFPVVDVLLALYALSFTATLLLAYLTLRRRTIPIAAACLFCLLVTCHPAWSEGLRGQFYPDRLFMFFGLLFMVAAASQVRRRSWLLVSAVLCLSIDERSAILAGLFLGAYTSLYWRVNPTDRILKLGLAAGLILYGLIVVKFFLPSNIYDGSFLPTSLASAIGRFQLPGFAHGALLFLAINAALWIIALFDWRAALIALLLMLPNVFGSIGGAEKLGWSTHYQDGYLPALIWAAMAGLTRAYRLLTAPPQRIALFGGICAIVCALALVNPYDGTAAYANVENQFVFWYPRERAGYDAPAERVANMWPQQLAQAVPEGSVVTTIESAMPALYHGRTLRLFPLDIDHANYAVMVYVGGAGENATYSGVVDYWGPDDTRAANAVIVERMRRDGYDFDHPVFTAPNGLIVLQRLPAGR
jgi:hypothetical protein